MFLHYILNEEKMSLIHQVLQAQMKNPSKNDFILTVKKDLKELNIHLSMEDIKNLSKESLKKFVKEQVAVKSLLFLYYLKEKHSKVAIFSMKN